jgi:hypothetical protein
MNNNQSVKKINFILFSTLILYVLIQLLISKPDTLLNDWLSWRQADTQTIAINFLEAGSNIFYPRINWGGNGPGFVEAEFQLYTYIIAQVMKLTGTSELPGVVLSLFFILLTALILYQTLLFVLNKPNVALIGSIAFLISNGAIHLSTSIIPDSLSILFYSLGLYSFIRYTKEQKYIYLILTVLATSLAGLVKPLALNLGIIQFLLLLFNNRFMLRKFQVWIAWLVILIIVGSYMYFSYNLYLKYGNTFGVIGGDQKFPTLKGLMHWLHYLKLIYMTVLWGLGPLGSIAIIYLLIKKKLTHIEWAMLIANIIVVFVAMRYMVNQGFSPHYYIFMDYFGCWLIAKAYEDIISSLIKNKLKLVNYLGILLLVMNFGFNLYQRIHPLSFHFDENVNKTGYILKQVAEPNSLIIVRSIASERERAEWGNRINNFEDPRIFYITLFKGWVIPFDYQGYKLVAKYRNQGAKYFVEPFDRPRDTQLERWLEKNSVMIHSDKHGRIYKFR